MDDSIGPAVTGFPRGYRYTCMPHTLRKEGVEQTDFSFFLAKIAIGASEGSMNTSTPVNDRKYLHSCLCQHSHSTHIIREGCNNFTSQIYFPNFPNSLILMIWQRQKS